MGGLLSWGRLTLADRKEITIGLHTRDSSTAIAALLGKAVSTVPREVAASGGRQGYRDCPRLAAQVGTWLHEW